LDDFAVVCTRLLSFRSNTSPLKVGKAVGMDRKDAGGLFRRMSADEPSRLHRCKGQGSATCFTKAVLGGKSTK
jgi:hypothetical protein